MTTGTESASSLVSAAAARRPARPPPAGGRGLAGVGGGLPQRVVARQLVRRLDRRAQTGGERDLVDLGLLIEERLRLPGTPRRAHQALERPVGEEVEPLAVGAPDRAPRVHPAVGESHVAAGLQRVEHDPAERGGRLDVRQPLAVRRPAQVRELAVAGGGDLRRRALRHVEEEQLLVLVAEGDPARIGRHQPVEPDHGVAAGELRRRADAVGVQAPPLRLAALVGEHVEGAAVGRESRRAIAHAGTPRGLHEPSGARGRDEHLSAGRQHDAVAVRR